MSDLADIFGERGRLAERLPGFTYRAAQRSMAERVLEALASHRHLLVEAGTGIGKTFAYLVPVLLSGRRTVISTGTRTLQDQLYARDLPMLGSALGRPVEVALLKGRSNYLCRHRLELARHGRELSAQWRAMLEAVADWGRASASGDLNELDDMPEDHPLRGWITSTAENCLGQRCEHYENCALVEARRNAQAAQVVIVNHHLLLADLALKDAGFGELLPGAEAVVVDEAHQLPDVAQQFFGFSVGTRELGRLARDTQAEAAAAGPDPDLERAAAGLLRACADSMPLAPARGGRIPWHGGSPRLRGLVEEWAQALGDLDGALAAPAESHAGLGRCRERTAEALARLARLAEAGSDGLRWFDITPQSLAMHWTPLETGQVLGERIAGHGGVWVLASATLAVGEDFGHFLRRTGVEDAATAVLPSPFDYEANARLYIPEGLPQPAQPDYVERLLDAVWPLVEASAGGAFLLFTSYRALGLAREWVARRGAPGPVLVQGDGPRTELLRRFREAGDGVLLGTSSFWQGIDVRGRALRLVVIDKLPFASPGDPVIQGRLDAIRAAGGDPFGEFQLPQAVLALKQGVGRLIRDFDDRGMIVLGDPRLRTRGYGRAFLASLPPMPLLETFEEALGFARELAEQPEAAQPAAVSP